MKTKLLILALVIAGCQKDDPQPVKIAAPKYTSIEGNWKAKSSNLVGDIDFGYLGANNDFTSLSQPVIKHFTLYGTDTYLVKGCGFRMPSLDVTGMCIFGSSDNNKYGDVTITMLAGSVDSEYKTITISKYRVQQTSCAGVVGCPYTKEFAEALVMTRIESN